MVRILTYGSPILHQSQRELCFTNDIMPLSTHLDLLCFHLNCTTTVDFPPDCLFIFYPCYFCRWYFQQLLITLHFTHHLGIPHGNLNLQNILLTLNPARPRSKFHHVKLTGFASSGTPLSPANPNLPISSSRGSSSNHGSSSSSHGSNSSSSKAAHKLSCSYFFSAPEVRSRVSYSHVTSSSCLDYSSGPSGRSSSTTSSVTATPRSVYCPAAAASDGDTVSPDSPSKGSSSTFSFSQTKSPAAAAAAGGAGGQTNTSRPPLVPSAKARIPRPTASNHPTKATATAAAAAAAAFQCDMWSCGVILFAMLTGHLPPIVTCDLPSFIRRRKSTPTSAVQMLQDLPSGVIISPDCLQLLTKLLHPNPEARVTLEGVMGHPWFLRGLPAGALGMNERLLRNPPAAVQSVEETVGVLEGALRKGVMLLGKSKMWESVMEAKP